MEIEITQVFKDQDSKKGSLLKAKETFRRNLLSNIVSELRKTDFPKCIFAIHLNDSAYSKKLNAKTIAKQCVESVLIQKENLKGVHHYEFENEGNLPDIIEGYTLGLLENLSETEYVETAGGTGLPLSNEYIQFILDKKEISKLDFKKCDFYWLIIKEGSFEADYFGKCTVEKSKLRTSFDKVFLLRSRGNEVLELK